MNLRRENVLALADHVEGLADSRYEDREGFYMSTLKHKCGTPACIAGWAAWLSGDRGNKRRHARWFRGLDGGGTLRAAREWLGLDSVSHVSHDLFTPTATYSEGYSFQVETPDAEGHITPRHAAAVLRHLAETGEVDWTAGTGAES